MRRMITLAAVAAAFLILGLIANVGIAWWLSAAGAGEPAAMDRTVALRVAEVRRWIDRSPGDRILQYSPSRVAGAPGVSRTIIEAEPPMLPQRWHRVMVVEAGWPLPALAGERWSTAESTGGNELSDSGSAPVVMLVDALDFITPGARRTSDAVAPLRPMWPGLATNSILYALALWMALVALPRGARILVRTRRGRCPACAHLLETQRRSACGSCGWMKGISNWREVAESNPWAD